MNRGEELLVQEEAARGGRPWSRRRMRRAWKGSDLPGTRGGGMASDERAVFLPNRLPKNPAARAAAETDPLVRKARYALGEAGRQGWAKVIGASPIARSYYQRKIRDAYERRAVLPLPG